MMNYSALEKVHKKAKKNVEERYKRLNEVKHPPKVVYTNIINLGGLYSDKPIKCKLTESDLYSGLGEIEWWDKSGDVDVKQLGLYKHDNNCFIQFSSLSKIEVQVWTDGVKAALSLIGNLCQVEQ